MDFYLNKKFEPINLASILTANYEQNMNKYKLIFKKGVSQEHYYTPFLGNVKT